MHPVLQQPPPRISVVLHRRRPGAAAQISAASACVAACPRLPCTGIVGFLARGQIDSHLGRSSKQQRTASQLDAVVQRVVGARMRMSAPQGRATHFQEDDEKPDEEDDAPDDYDNLDEVDKDAAVDLTGTGEKPKQRTPSKD